MGRHEVDENNIIDGARKRNLTEKAAAAVTASKRPKPDDSDARSRGSSPPFTIISDSSESYEDDNQSAQTETSDNDMDTDDDLPRIIAPKKSGTGKAKARFRKRKSVRTDEEPAVEPPSAQPIAKPTPVESGTATGRITEEPSKPSEPIFIERPNISAPKKFQLGDNPLFLFYQKVFPDDAEIDSAYYKCPHPHVGIKKPNILKISKNSRWQTTGLRQHLEKHEELYELYNYLKISTLKELPTKEMVAIARGEVITSFDQLREITGMSKESNRLPEMFARRKNKTEPWDHTEFKRRLVRWVVARDQPFTTVEDTEFQELLEYTHSGNTTLSIPSADVVKRLVQDLKAEFYEKTIELTTGLESRVALSLDAWTSSNGYAFLAIVMHYISNEWVLNETLIAFEEIRGRHTGDNMGAIVLKILDRFQLASKLIAINCDNAANNDTMLRYLELELNKRGIQFSAEQARMRCMPHTIHLAAMKLLASIGVTKNITESSGNYQDDVYPPTEENEVELNNDDVDDSEDDDSERAITAVAKLRQLTRAIRKSTQAREEWLANVSASESNTGKKENALLLILDVPTRWSSTHHMLERALRFQSSVATFCFQPKYRIYELSPDDWEAVKLVANWLQLFRKSTEKMSATHDCMLSSTFACFLVLQNHLRACMKKLPSSASSRLHSGLRAAHEKLAEYLGRFCVSVYYLWAALLDPRISYLGLKNSVGGDEHLLELIESAKFKLEDHFRQHYAPKRVLEHAEHSSDGSRFINDFVQIFAGEMSSGLSNDELEVYFSLKVETSWALGEPIKWWAARRSQFPSLSRLARDIHCIPGSAVAVERIFSSGHDTIALRRSSLQPGTISDLMIVKHALRRTE